MKNKGQLTVNLNLVGRLCLLLLCLALSWLNCLGTIMLWKQLGISNVGKPIHLTIVPLVLVEYALISLAAVCFAALIKGGFSRLKNIEGLIAGLITGFIIQLLFVFFFVICGCLFGCLVASLIVGAIVGLVAGLLVGLVTGLVGEFTA